MLAFVFTDFVLFILLSVSQCILLCFRFRVYVCNVFVSSCLLCLIFFVVLCPYVTFLRPFVFVIRHSVGCIIS